MRATTPFGRLKSLFELLNARLQRRRKSLQALTAEELREIRGEADYLSVRINESAGELAQGDMERLASFTKKLERLNQSK